MQHLSPRTAILLVAATSILPLACTQSTTPAAKPPVAQPPIAASAASAPAVVAQGGNPPGNTPGANPGNTPGGGRGGRGGGAGGRGGGGRGPARPALPDPLPPFYDPTLSLEKRVDDLVSRLTLEEKIAQMQMAAPALPRLGIPPYDWWSEALHGVANQGTATVFPQAIGMAAAWDVNLHHDMAKIIGLEARAKYVASQASNNFSRFHGIDLWSPNVNIFRDPRWGRGQETYGEDPYLTSRLGIEFVKGLQGDDPFYFLTVATPKHFAVHSGPESQRHRFDAVVTDEDLYTTYLPQFEATVREGHAYSMMSAYSAIDGVPDSGNKRLLTDILRTQWGFNGYVVSDVDSVSDIFQRGSHAFVANAMEASALAVKSGNDLNSGTTYGEGNGGPSNLAKAIQAGLITEKEVDVSLRRLMEARIRLGQFDPPGYTGNPYNKITAAMNDLPESDAVAHRMADESMVLLKNANQTLPLKTSLRTIAVIGPNANSLNMQYGEYNGTPSNQHRMSIIDGIRNAVGADHVITTTTLQVPLNSRVALAEPLKSDYLFTDATKTRHGLNVAYAADPAGLGQPAHLEVSESGELKRPDAATGIAFDPRMAVKMTGVLVPPATGDYQLGAKGRDGFKLSIDGQVVIDESQGGALRAVGNPIHLEKDKTYALAVEFTHTPTSGGLAGGRGGPGGRGGRGPGGGPPGATAPAGAPGEILGTAPAGGGGPPGGGGGGGRGGRGGRGGGPAFGATTEAPGITATPSADPATDPLFQIAWTKPTNTGAPANTAGESLYGEAIDLATKADAVVLVVGISPTMEGEMRDRDNIEMPPAQEGLIRAVTKAAGNKPVIVVDCSGSPMALTWENENVPAILQAWYPGQRGDAVADVLFGKYNPAGRLPVTFYKATSDLPPFTDYAMVNRTYRYDTRPVLYTFGYGLSYSNFTYSSLTAPARAGTGDDVKVSVDVRNSSAVDGEEVVQCYINRDVPPIDRASLPDPTKMTDEQATQAATPRKTLVGFARVALKAGESKNITFTVTTQQLSLVVGKDGKREVRPGNLQLQVDGNSAIGPGTLTQALTLEGSPKAPEYHFVGPVVK